MNVFRSCRPCSLSVRVLVIVSFVSFFLASCSSDDGMKNIPDPYEADETIISILFDQTLEDNHLQTGIFLESDRFTIQSSVHSEFYYAIHNSYDTERCFYVQPICLLTMSALDCDMKSMSVDSEYYFSWFNLSRSHIIGSDQTHFSKAFIFGEGERDEYIIKLVLWSSRSYDGNCLERIIFRQTDQMKRESEANLRLILT